MKRKFHRIIGWIVLTVFFLLITVEGFSPLVPMKSGLNVNQALQSQPSISEAEETEIPEQLEEEEYNTIKQYSSEYGIDHLLILAIIKQESQFDDSALSIRGATGLMQIMPVTNAELIEKLNLEDTNLVRGNVRMGIYYFTKLFELFQGNSREDRICLALAAYNAGPSRIYDAQELAAYMGENPNSWTAIQNVLPLLSKRYYSLHQAVWSEGRPRSGYFGSWRQTVIYVGNIMKIYAEYRKKIG